MTKMLRIAACLMAMGLIGGAQAQAADGVKAILDPASQCKVFAAPGVYKPLPAMKWNGKCRDGFAEGQGTATFAATSASLPSKTWQGNFHAGFFLGNAMTRGRIEAPGGSTVLVEFPVASGDDLSYWVVTRLTDSEPLQVCGGGTAEVLIEAPHDLAKNDDDGLRQLMRRAAVFYRQVCPAPVSMRFLVVSPQGRGSVGGIGFGAKEKEIARAQLASDAPPDKLYNFNNYATGESDQGKKTAALEAKKKQDIADSRVAWNVLSQKNKVTLWTTPKLIAANPFRYGDRIVAFPGRFDAMEGPGSAVIRDSQGGYIMVTGLANDALTKPGDAIFIGRVVGQRDVQVNSRVSVKAPTVEIGSVQVCARKGCTDYLWWMDDEKPSFPWGEDQSKYLTP